MFLLDSIIFLYQSWSFICIGCGGLAPNRVETLANPVPKYNFYTDFTDQNRSARGANFSEVVYLSSGIQIGRPTYES